MGGRVLIFGKATANLQRRDLFLIFPHEVVPSKKTSPTA
jgi:hypothetical protein